MEQVKKGDTIRVHYRGTFDDGEEFDSSYSRDEPLTTRAGVGNLIPGFDNALIGMTPGDTKTVNILAADAYGEINPEARQTIPKDQFPADLTLEEGSTIQGRSPQGQQVLATIQSVNESDVVLDFNHPMAGKNLNFEIEVVDIEGWDE